MWYTEYTSPAFSVVHGIHLPSVLGYRQHLARITVLLLYLQVFYRWCAVSLCTSLHLKQISTNILSFSNFFSFLLFVPTLCLEGNMYISMYFIYSDCSLYLRGTYNVSACWWCHQMMSQLRCNDISVINME